MVTLRDANPPTIGELEVSEQESISCEDFMLLDRVSFRCHQACCLGELFVADLKC